MAVAMPQQAETGNRFVARDLHDFFCQLRLRSTRLPPVFQPRSGCGPGGPCVLRVEAQRGGAKRRCEVLDP